MQARAMNTGGQGGAQQIGGQNLYRNPGVFTSNAWQKQTGGFQTQTQNRLKSLQATAKTDVDALLRGIPQRPEEPTKQIQVSDYLEALPDRIEETTHETQTDPMAEVRDPAPYREPPQGIEKETQVYEGDLFDFDREVQPILDVLVGSVLQQVLTEYADEEEIRLIREARNKLKQKRVAELQEVRRLEEAEKRKREEIVRRQAEDLRRKSIEETLAKKIQSQQFARAYCKQLEADVLEQLEQKGAFTSKLENAVTGQFIPNIIKLGTEKAKARDRIHELLKQMIREAVEQGIAEEKAAQ